MGPVRLAVGAQWLVDGRTWRVVRQLAPDRFVAQDAQFLVEQEFSSATILSQYAEGRLRFATDDSQRPAPRPAKARPRTIQDLSEPQKQLLQQR